MATNIMIPRLGMATAEATIIEWAVKEGEQVGKNQVVAIIEVDKIRSDVAAPAAGFVHILAEEGSMALVGAVIGTIADAKEELETLQKKTPEVTATEVRDGQIVIRPIMTYSLTYDHRVIDDAVAAKFMTSLINLLENPAKLLS